MWVHSDFKTEIDWNSIQRKIEFDRHRSTEKNQHIFSPSKIELVEFFQIYRIFFRARYKHRLLHRFRTRERAQLQLATILNFN